jgi:Methyltransferase domain
MRLLDRLVDFALLLFAPLAAPFLYVAARKRSKLRLTRKFQDLIGVTVVRNHYHEPVITDKNLSAPPEQVRVLPGFDFNFNGQMEILDRFTFSDELLNLEKLSSAGQPFRYDNHGEVFAEGDAEALYSFVRAFKPGTIIEIGAGQSSIVIELAIERNRIDDLGYAPRHICFEPFENPWLESLGATIRRERIETADLSIFADLREGDILFIDSTHVIRPQGDVECVILKILPILKPGVLVHFHDIFSPRDYISKFIIEDRKFWNEQYLLEAFLSMNPHYEVILALHDLQQRREPKLYASFPMLKEKLNRNPGSFWIRRLPAKPPADFSLQLKVSG